MAQVKQIRVEVEDDHLMVVLPWLMDDWVTPWQEAYTFGDVLEKAAEDIPNKGGVQPVAAEIMSAAIRLTTDKKNVVMIFDHTDRIKLSYEAARMVGRAIKLKAQDLMYLYEKGVHMNYGVKGRRGRVTPFFDASRFPKSFGQLGKNKP